MIESIASWATLVVVGLAAWLLPKYLERRVTEAARGAVDVSVGKALADYGLNVDRQLETYRSELAREIEALRQSLAFDRERYARDYGLFATKRNEAYAETFARLEKARGAYARRFASLISYRDFGQSPESDVRHLAQRLEHVTAGERKELMHLLDSGRLDEARGLANSLNERDELRQANREFYDFRNTCVLNALYFSQPVDDLLSEAVRDLALLSVYADEIIDGEDDDVRPRTRSDQVGKVDVVTGKVRRAMRQDMQAGFAASPSQVSSSAGRDA